jgi:23S rRNA (cytidine1920-2'-O)/16S rRNA (cytidine1409-2'-O)-methyltransferase
VRRRLDTELVRRGLAASTNEAALAIRTGRVRVGGRIADKSSTLVASGESLSMDGPPGAFVSRGGEKLDAALDRFLVDAAGRMALDAGASTGGFTDCLLRRGAAAVVAVDVGYGQLAWAIRTDPRVTALERTNVRDLTAGDLPFPPDLVVADLSFISLSLVMPSLASVAAPGADFVLLVKPQFEAGRADVGAGGVVREPAVWQRVLEDVVASCVRVRLAPRGVMASPLLGPAGNAEFLLHAKEGVRLVDLDVSGAVREAETMRAAS